MKPSQAFLRVMTIASRVNRRLVEEKVADRLAIRLHPEDFSSAWKGMMYSGQTKGELPDAKAWDVLGMRIVEDETAPRL